MPTDHQDLIYNVTGQSFVIDVPEGQPSSLTSVNVYPWDSGDDATAETATTGSASIDSVSTTLDGNAGLSQANSRLIPLTATTNVVVGRDYLITSADGIKEWVEVMEIDSGVSVTARVGLLNNFASADTFKGTRISISVLDAWIQNSAKLSGGIEPNPQWRVKWIYVVDSVTYSRYTFCDVVRDVGDHNVSSADMALYLGTWEDQLPLYHRSDQGRGLINEGYRLLQADLLAIDVPDQQLRNQEAVDEAVKRATNVVLQRSRYYSGQVESEALDRAVEEYNGYFNRVFAVSSRVALSTSTTGAGTKVSATGIWSR